MAGELKTLLESTRPNFSLLPGGWEPDTSLIPMLERIKPQDLPDDQKPRISCLPIHHGVGTIVKNALTPANCESLIYFMSKSPNTEGVSVQGRKDVPDYRVGSVRTTIWAPSLASQIWKTIQGYIPSRRMSDRDATDWWQGDKTRTRWYPVALSPMLRFMRYESGGQHYAHYDAGFIYPNDNYRTLQSVVIYLTTNPDGGATRFIEDSQANLPVWERDHRDWTREVKPSEVLYASQPEAGKILTFDHRLCHDVETYRGTTPRVIIRADIVFSTKFEDRYVEN